MHQVAKTRPAQLILFNKPYGVLSQFTDDQGRETLADYIDEKGIYPAGRLDRDSEGSLLLTDNGLLQQQIANPRQKTWKTYLVQVEGSPDTKALEQLQQGIELKDGMTRPAQAQIINAPAWLWPRNPPVRYRKTVPDHWIELKIREGRNRQVRRMTAAVGLPTLRLIRTQVGNWQLGALLPGEYSRQAVEVTQEEKYELDTARHRRRHHRKRRPVSHGKGKQ